jgi:hypothetical protein
MRNFEERRRKLNEIQAGDVVSDENGTHCCGVLLSRVIGKPRVHAIDPTKERERKQQPTHNPSSGKRMTTKM